jgi:alpha-galactosidase
MLIGCDLTQMDEFTKAVLMNDEVLAVDQDPLGKQGYRVDKGEAAAQVQVYKRELWDGTVAVALFNLGHSPAEVTAEWSDLGLTGKQPVRDLWHLKDLGESTGHYTVEVPRHGCVLVKVGRPSSEADAVKAVVALYQK